MDVKLVVVGGDAKPAEINLKLPTIVGRGRGSARHAFLILAGALTQLLGAKGVAPVKRGRDGKRAQAGWPASDASIPLRDRPPTDAIGALPRVENVGKERRGC